MREQVTYSLLAIKEKRISELHDALETAEKERDALQDALQEMARNAKKEIVYAEKEIEQLKKEIARLAKRLHDTDGLEAEDLQWSLASKERRIAELHDVLEKERDALQKATQKEEPT